MRAYIKNRPVSELDGKHEGEDVFIVGTGTSLRDFDWSLLDGRVTIGLNDAIRGFLPTYHMYTDNIGRRYVRLHRKNIIYKKIYAGGSDVPRSCHRSYWFEFKRRIDVCQKNDLYVFATVAASAIHVASRMRCHRIFLLGVDCYRLDDGTRYFNGATRSNNKQYKAILRDGRFVKEKQHNRWIRAMETLRRHFQKRNLYQGSYPESGIYNLNPESYLETWEKVNPKEVLCKEALTTSED